MKGELRLTDIDAEFHDMVSDLPTVLQRVIASSMRDGATVRAPFGDLVWAMWPPLDGGFGAALQQQSHLTALRLRGGWHQGTLHSIFVTGAIGLRSLRSLDLSINTLKVPHVIPSHAVHPSRTLIATTVGVMLRVVTHLAIPLERLRLCGEHDDVLALCGIMQRIHTLTTLTRLDLNILKKMLPFECTPDVYGYHHLLTLRSLSTLRCLSLSISFNLIPDLAGYLPASGLTELRLHLGYQGLTEAWVIKTAVTALEQIWAPGRHSAAADGHTAAHQAPCPAGMHDLRVLRVGVQQFSGAVEAIEEAGLEWERVGGTSRLRRGIFIPADQAAWLESCGELQRLLEAVPGRLVVILGGSTLAEVSPIYKRMRQ